MRASDPGSPRRCFSRPVLGAAHSTAISFYAYLHSHWPHQSKNGNCITNSAHSLSLAFGFLFYFWFLFFINNTHRRRERPKSQHGKLAITTFWPTTGNEPEHVYHGHMSETDHRREGGALGFSCYPPFNTGMLSYGVR